MQRIVYLLVSPILYLISILPFRLLYVLSDVICFFIYYIIRYRRKTVDYNLQLVFPNKTIDERNTIRKRFYSHMVDLFMEMIKTMTISKKELDKRFLVKNPETAIELGEQEKSIVVMYGHYASYEWSFVAQNYMKCACYGVYKKLKNKHFDALIKRIRSKYNTIMIDTKETIPTMKNLHDRNQKFMIGFIADQSPKFSPKNVWLDFMEINIPCFVGAESIAKKLDFSVAYLKIDKIKRGHYQGEFIMLAEESKNFKDFEITEKFNTILESQIRSQPEYYLWTHKRWKHKDKKKFTN